MINNDILEEFLYQYNQKNDYYECHEILEEEWKRVFPKRNKKTIHVVLLQIAVCLFHIRNCNYSGATQILGYIKKNMDDEVLCNLEKYFIKNDIIDIINELELCINQQIYRHLYLRRKHEKI